MLRTASFSRCGRYRYSLTRIWDESRPGVLLIGLNPSKADAQQDDPTIRRCIGLARSWGFGRFVIVNLFALCSPSPAVLRAVDDPIGPRSNRVIRTKAQLADQVVLMWGNHGRLYGRDQAVLDLLPELPLHCIGQTAVGAPRHLLYARRDAALQPFDQSDGQPS